MKKQEENRMLQPATKVTYKGKRFNVINCINAGDIVDIKKQGERYLIYSRRSGYWSAPGAALIERKLNG